MSRTPPKGRVWTAPTAAAVAAFFGVSTSAVRKWRSEGCPAPTAAGWDLGALVRWKLEREAARRRREQEQDPDRQLKTWRVRLARLKFRQERGTLIERRVAAASLENWAITSEA